MKFVFANTLAAAVIVAGSASAAVFSVVPAPPFGSPSTVPAAGFAPLDFGPLKAGPNPGVAVDLNDPLFKDDANVQQLVPGVTQVATFESPGGDPTQGLFLQGSGTVTVTFLGRDAGFVDIASVNGGGSSFDNRSAFGSSYSFIVNQGALTSLVSLVFATGSKSAINGGAVDSDLSISFSNPFNNGNSVLAFFEDLGFVNNSDNTDIDDMIVRLDVVPIPLPAGIWMFVTALGGLGLLSRRKAIA